MPTVKKISQCNLKKHKISKKLINDCHELSFTDASTYQETNNEH